MKAKPARENPSLKAQPACEGVSPWTNRATNLPKSFVINVIAGFAQHTQKTSSGIRVCSNPETKAAKAERFIVRLSRLSSGSTCEWQGAPQTIDHSIAPESHHGVE